MHVRRYVINFTENVYYHQSNQTKTLSSINIFISIVNFLFLYHYFRFSYRLKPFYGIISILVWDYVLMLKSLHSPCYGAYRNRYFTPLKYLSLSNPPKSILNNWIFPSSRSWWPLRILYSNLDSLPIKSHLDPWTYWHLRKWNCTPASKGSSNTIITLAKFIPLNSKGSFPILRDRTSTKWVEYLA